MLFTLGIYFSNALEKDVKSDKNIPYFQCKKCDLVIENISLNKYR